MKAELLRRAFLVTPNIPEAEALSGMTIASVTLLAVAVVGSFRAGPANPETVNA